MKLAIVNQPLANRGDEAAHKAFVRELAKAFPKSSIDVIFLGVKDVTLIDSIRVDAGNVHYRNIQRWGLEWRLPKYVFLLHMLPLSFLHPALRKFRKILKSYDAVLCAPGGICMGGFLNWNHIWELETARRLGKPVFYWGRSIGPFTDEDYAHSVFKKESSSLLAYFSFLSLRDDVSVRIAEGLGAHPVPVVDSAFLETPDAVIPEAVRAQWGGQYVVFVPNALTWHYRYRNVPQERIDRFHLEIIELLSEKYPGHTIVMLPQTYRSVINDYGYFRRLAERAAGKPVAVIDEDQSSDVQQKIIAGARMVIGERYHSVVFAINNRTPFVSLSYEHKMTGLLEKLGLTERSVDVQGIFADGSGEACRHALEQVRSLLEQDVFVPPQLDPRAFVREGFEKLCRSIEELVQGKAG